MIMHVKHAQKLKFLLNEHLKAATDSLTKYVPF